MNTQLMRCVFVVAVLLCGQVEAVAKNGSGFNYFQSLTGDDSDSDKSRWDNLYRKSKGYVFGKEPATFLVENLQQLPIGRALDLAMGEGRNAVYLAKKGFDVVGVDISEVAVRKAKHLARENGVRIQTVIADLHKYQLQPESYDVILVFYYLQRSLVPQIVRALKPGGVLVFESETVDDLKHHKTQNHAGLLEHGELKTLFNGLSVVKYAETDDGKRAVASLVARKPKK
jgi:SAM-dependent methyltransferase